MRRSKRAAFTLIELLLVVVIIGILAAIVVPKLTGKSETAKIGATQATMKSLRTALAMYETDNGRFPTQEQGLLALIELPTSAPIPKKYAKDGYLDTKDLPKDGWGIEIKYTIPGIKNTNGYDLRSAGPDEQFDNDDDIVMP